MIDKKMGLIFLWLISGSVSYAMDVTGQTESLHSLAIIMTKQSGEYTVNKFGTHSDGSVVTINSVGRIYQAGKEQDWPHKYFVLDSIKTEVRLGKRYVRPEVFFKIAVTPKGRVAGAVQGCGVCLGDDPNLQNFDYLDELCSDLVLNNDGTVLAAVLNKFNGSSTLARSWSHTINLFEIPKILDQHFVFSKAKRCLTEKPLPGFLSCMAVYSDKKFATGVNSLIRIWQLKNMKASTDRIVGELQISEGEVKALQFLDDKHLVVGIENGTLAIFDGICRIHTIHGHSYPVKALTLDNEKKVIYSLAKAEGELASEVGLWQNPVPACDTFESKLLKNTRHADVVIITP